MGTIFRFHDLLAVIHWAMCRRDPTDWINFVFIPAIPNDLIYL